MAIEKYMSDVAPSEDDDASEETASLPVSILAGKTVEPGDVVRLEVVSVDDGNITVKYATESPEKKDHECECEKEDKGVKSMAAEFD